MEPRVAVEEVGVVIGMRNGDSGTPGAGIRGRTVTRRGCRDEKGTGGGV